VGKTAVACGIARCLEKRGAGPLVFKPFASGSRADASRLKEAARSSQTPEEITPFFYREPLAPYAASKLGGEKFSLSALRRSIAAARSSGRFVVAEGAGGVAVPLGKDYFVRDLMKEMGFPALVVAHAGLGTLNHTLLTLESLRRKNVEVLGIVLNFFDPGDLAARTNLLYFREKNIPVLAVLRRDPRLPRDHDLASALISRSPLGRRLGSVASPQIIR